MDARTTFVSLRDHRPRAPSLCAALLLFLSSAAHAEPAPPDRSRVDDAYVLGVFPFIAVPRLEAIFAPIAARIDTDLGRPVHLRTARNYPNFMEKLEKGDYDIAFIQPFDYVRIAEPAGYRPLVRRREPLFAVLVTTPDHPVQDLKGLAGKVVALPPEMAAVSYLVRLTLRHAGLDPHRDVTLRYTKNHETCMQLLVIREADACGSAPIPVALAEQKLGIRTRELGRSVEIPGSLFVARADLPEADRLTLIHTLLAIADFSEPDRPPPQQAPASFEAASSEEYDPVRRYWLEIGP